MVIRSLILSLLFLAILMPETVHSQYRWRRGREFIEPERDIFPGNGFTFCRLRYNSNPGGWRGRGGSWLTDYPDSDLNFSQRLSELTTIQVNRSAGGAIQHAIVGLMEADLFNYPFLYTLEVEGLYFSEAESKRLRSYLLRGGFLMVDDFWGSNAWANFEYEIGKALPPEDYPIVDIPLDHEIFHIVFQVNEVPQIPGIDWWYRTGMTAEPREGSQEPHCRGIFDKKGRLMVVILHNTDLGDGWEEEARNPIYFREFSARKAYPLGINIVVYAMTH